LVLREEEHTTRGRAHLLFEMLQGDLIRDGWQSREVKEALDLCLSCKGCKAECPVNVDMATYKAEFLAHHHAGRPRDARRRAAMKAKLLHDEGQKTFAVIFDRDEEVAAGLTAFARKHRLSAAHFTAIGALSRAVLGYFQRERREYKRIPIDEQVEVLVMAGDITLQDGEPKVHAHVVVGKSDGTAHGGHLMEARVWPTLEVVIVESPAHLVRRMDESLGFAVIAPEGQSLAA
jgi:predicted DNA-binding protein with PD1-like motif